MSKDGNGKLILIQMKIVTKNTEAKIIPPDSNTDSIFFAFGKCPPSIDSDSSFSIDMVQTYREQ